MTPSRICFALAALVAGAVATPGTATASSGAGQPRETTYYNIVSDLTGKCWDSYVHDSNNGRSIVQYQCGETWYQQWFFTSRGDGAFTIRNAKTGKCVDLRREETANRTDLTQWDCDGSASQRWRLHDTGDGALNVVSDKANRCAEFGDATGNDSQIFIWDCDGTSDQRWSLQIAD